MDGHERKDRSREGLILPYPGVATCAVDREIKALMTVLPAVRLCILRLCLSENRRTAAGRSGKIGGSIGGRRMSDKETECTHCGYEWTYRGGMPDGAYVTCPACQGKTQVVVDAEP